MDVRLTDREAQIMEVIWGRGPSTVSEVRSALADELAYTTVQTLVRILEEKGYVSHDQYGKAHRYSALVQRETAQRSASRDLAQKLFKGSTELLLSHLVEDEGLSRTQIRRIRKMLEEREKAER
jgi:BlaI family transcriptional regulator, penicillinase repressor